MDGRIRWGVISTANIGRGAVIPAIKASRNGEVLAVASRDESRARAFAKELGIERSYGSYEALLADPDIDAIYNPLPNDGHAPWSIASAKAGKPTLCEKPIARTAAEAKTVVDTFRQANVLLAEAFMYRYHPQHATVKKLVEQGTIGTPNLITAAFTYSLSQEDTTNVRLNSEIGGGAILDVGCYCVNACRMLAGMEPQSVSAFAVYGERSRVDETVVGILQFPGGLLAHFDCGMRSSGGMDSHDRNEYTILGPKGSITADLAFRPEDDGETTVTVRLGNTKLQKIVIPACNEYVLMVEDFAEAVL